jgi:hypothetical protein
MSPLTEPDLRSYLRFNRQPLTELRQDDNWWRLGPLAVSKKHATFCAGFGHPILSDTRFELQSYDIDGTRGIAVILHSGGKPPEYFAGWVPLADENRVKEWVKILNTEVQRRVLEASNETLLADRDADEVPGLAFEQGHEYAPDSPYGLERLELAADGALTYERLNRDERERLHGTVDPARVAALHRALRETSFPIPPQQRFVPGASIVKITLLSSGVSVNVDYFEALRMDGYCEVVRELSALTDAVRETNVETLAGWNWRPSE